MKGKKTYLGAILLLISSLTGIYLDFKTHVQLLEILASVHFKCLALSIVLLGLRSCVSRLTVYPKQWDKHSSFVLKK